MYFSVLLMMACTDHLTDQIDVGEGYLQLSFLQAESRAVVGSDGSGFFSNGDQVGLYIDNGDQVQYQEMTYQDGDWFPRLKRSEFGYGRGAGCHSPG